MPKEDPYPGLQRRVGAAVRRACRGWPAADVEDLIQTVLAALVRKAASSGEENTAYSSIYLEKMAHGVLVDELRRRARRPEVIVDDAVLARRAGTTRDPEAAAQGAETARTIRCCLGRMRAPRRRAVALYLLGCGPSEVAMRSGWSERRAQNLIYRGLVDLRRCLQQEGVSR